LGGEEREWVRAERRGRKVNRGGKEKEEGNWECEGRGRDENIRARRKREEREKKERRKRSKR
jgi:hypothetical protein